VSSTLAEALRWLARLIRPGASPALALTREDRELLADPWYHDFASLGMPTPAPGSSHQQNQHAKQPAICELVTQAIHRCWARGGRADGVELFCADGFYSHHALRRGADSMLGVDADARAIEKANLMAKLLDDAHRCRFEQRDVFELDGTFDFGICAGGLYHLADPLALLTGLRQRIRTALVVQSVYSLAHEEPDYFETPAPGWTWGCRFSHAYLLEMVARAGWEIVAHSTNILEGNPRPEDRGSAYLLCLPAEP
jgi:2-polyprenyl-3-methyl-5-hydroxy-6-metoxy-1,4-benzoquinol methylase